MVGSRQYERIILIYGLKVLIYIRNLIPHSSFKLDCIHVITIRQRLVCVCVAVNRLQ